MMARLHAKCKNTEAFSISTKMHDKLENVNFLQQKVKNDRDFNGKILLIG